jgi:hypothetical protein
MKRKRTKTRRKTNARAVDGDCSNIVFVLYVLLVLAVNQKSERVFDADSE